MRILKTEIYTGVLEYSSTSTIYWYLIVLAGVLALENSPTRNFEAGLNKIE
jgi:hypothetical protein